MMNKYYLWMELRACRRAVRKANAACVRACSQDDIAGLYEALARVRATFECALIDAEVAYLKAAL